MLNIHRFKVACIAVVVLPMVGFVAAAGLALSHGRVGGLELATCLAMFVVTFIGIEVGYHRHFVHRSFCAVPTVRYILGAMGSMAFQGSVIWWSGIHRTHHQFPDQEGDPHSPLDGFFQAHVGWLLGQNINPPGWTRRVKDLIRDPTVRMVHRHYLVFAVLGLISPAIAIGLVQGTWQGFLAGLLWGGFVRILIVNHVVWSINSVCHAFGQRPYDTQDLSCNNYLLMLPSLGFSLHNNHHAFPRAATTSHAWWQVDLCGWVIRLLVLCRLAWGMNLPTAEQKQMRRKSRIARSFRGWHRLESRP